MGEAQRRCRQRVCFVSPPAPLGAGEALGVRGSRTVGARPGSPRPDCGLLGPRTSWRARCMSAGRGVRCARAGPGPGSWVLGSDPHSAAETQRPRLHNGVTAAITGVERQAPPGTQARTQSVAMLEGRRVAPSGSLRAHLAVVPGLRSAQHAGSQGLSVPVCRAAGSEPENGRGPGAKGAARPSGAAGVWSRAGCWAGRTAAERSRPGRGASKRDGQDALWRAEAVAAGSWAAGVGRGK